MRNPAVVFVCAVNKSRAAAPLTPHLGSFNGAAPGISRTM